MCSLDLISAIFSIVTESDLLPQIYFQVSSGITSYHQVLCLTVRSLQENYII
jgi:hypothetical protein